MDESVDPKLQTAAEEWANFLTHAAAAISFAVVLLIFLFPASHSISAGRIASVVVYGCSLVLLYLTSSCYHICRAGSVKRKLRAADHAAIFLLIAGTYTPLMLTVVGGAWGISIVCAMWVLALVGCVLKVLFVGRFSAISTAIYVVMGWSAVIATRPILEHVSSGCIMLLIIGGVSYTAGIIFYAWEKLPFNHAVWHLFVIGGSTAHFIAVVKYVLPAA